MTTALELQHFAVLTISYFHLGSSIFIVTTTNNPCHLTCYYTDKTPVRHATSLVKRGVALPWGAYFCFVAWKSVEQQEAGLSQALLAITSFHSTPLGSRAFLTRGHKSGTSASGATARSPSLCPLFFRFLSRPLTEHPCYVIVFSLVLTAHSQVKSCR